ncbi:MAG: PocR ligand-binding domain-containing protein [Actinomycetota bacterium]|nr:PocR ligand-binding domain-containing protein [Actinomycetota bacterium]
MATTSGTEPAEFDPIKLTLQSNGFVAPEAEPKPNANVPWQLTDLIEVSVLQSIQDTFAKVFGLPTVITDLGGRNVTNITHRVRFCEDLTRPSRIGGARCTGCDLQAMEQASEANRPAIFKCWNGLYDCAIPIAPKGEVLGYFLCGQILTGLPDADRFARTAEEIGTSPEAYLQALRGVRVMPLDQYESSIRTMHTLAQMIADQAAASIDNLKVLQDALEAKDDAARLVDELEVILEAFRDSFAQPDERSTLETIADQLQRLIPCDSCLIYTVDDGADELIPQVVRDRDASAFRAFRPRKGVGVWGQVAATGVRRKIDDVREDPDFAPVPGVDVEPEAMLVAPMIRKGTIFGVISLSRLERRVFTEHELRILAVFCSHASLSLEVSRMHARGLSRLREEHALGELLSAMNQGLNADETLSAIGRWGLEVLDARSAVLQRQPEPGAPTRLVGISIAERESAELLAELEPEIEEALARRACRVLERGGSSYLVAPLLCDAEVLGFALFAARGGRQWDQSIVDTFARQSSLGLRNALACERERRVLLQHDLLSSLGGELAQAKSPEEIRVRLLGKTSEIFASELSILAMLNQASDAIQIHVREGRSTRELSIKLAGRARFASARLSGETAPEDSVFTAWAQDVIRELARELGVVSYIGAPLRSAAGVLGGLFVAWRTEIERFSPEQQRLLSVVAGAAGAALSSFLARAETDHSLRRRLAELQALARLAEQITSLTEEGPILDEVLAAIQELAGLKGAVYAVQRDGRWTARRATGLNAEEIAELTELLAGLEPHDQTMRHDLAGGDRQILSVPIPGMEAGAALIAGVSPRRGDPQRDIVLAAIVRFSSVALENANLHSRRRGTISRLENANEKLSQVLLVHETLTSAVVSGDGIQAVADSLAGLTGGAVLILGSMESVLARSSDHGDLAWRPPKDELGPRTISIRDDAGYIVAAPATVHDEILAWVVARFESSPGQVERGALEYGALLVALERLRERTALEVEHRLRGGFLEELFSGEFAEPLIVKQGAAFGFDLTTPTRIYLIEPVERELSQADGRLLDSIASECAASWLGRHLVALESTAAVVLIEEQEVSGPPHSGCFFEDRLQQALLQRMAHCPLNIAVSRLVRTLPDYGKAYAAARRGLDLIGVLGRAGEIVSFRNMGVQEILLQVDEPAALLEFIARYVKPLELYDAEHSSNLLNSLETFYEAGFNLQEAARRLDVHVSTLRYRLTRIEDLLGVDPKVGDSRLNIEVAVKAAKALAVDRD